jgi:SAM-dependent methyltransferase
MTRGTALAPQRSWQEAYLEQFYYGRPNWVDGTAEFHGLIREHLPAGAETLELGAGPANPTTRFLAETYAAVDGLDVDQDAKTNPDVRSVFLYQGGRWPVADAGYDAVVANYVLEHLDRPADTLAEAYRALRPGGLFFFRTPNLWHYVTLASRLTPHWFHRLVANRLRRRADGAHDPYPTCYRMNRGRTVRALMSRAGFREVRLYTVEKEPSYGLCSRALFLPFLAYERLVNSSPRFGPFRANLLGVFVKPWGNGALSRATTGA